MPELNVAIALVLLVALVEATPAARVPIGLLLAIAMLAADAELFAVALLGAAGVTIARLSLALGARAGRDRLGAPSPAAQAQRDALRAQLAGSPAYTRITFVMAALPGVPAGFLFPLLGAMRAPLWPALAGTLVGRVPILALTAALFSWLGQLFADTDDEAAVALGVLAIGLLVMRTIGRIDWQHRTDTGEWRMRDENNPFVQMSMRVGDVADTWTVGPDLQESSSDDPDVVEGELLGEEVVDPDSDDDAPPPELPSSGSPST